MVIVGIIMIGSGLLIYNINPQKSATKKEGFVLKDYKKMTMCPISKGCELEDAKFKTIEFDTTIEMVSNKIAQINKETKDYYEMASASTTDDSEVCAHRKDAYKYSSYITTDYQLYENDEIISIAVNRVIQNLCTNSQETTPYDIFIYDKKQKKELTQQELLDRLGYTDDMIKGVITDMIKSKNEIGDNFTTLENVFVGDQVTYSLFYNNKGNIMLAYQVRNQENFRYEQILMV